MNDPGRLMERERERASERGGELWATMAVFSHSCLAITRCHPLSTSQRRRRPADCDFLCASAPCGALVCRQIRRRGLPWRAEGLFHCGNLHDQHIILSLAQRVGGRPGGDGCYGYQNTRITRFQVNLPQIMSSELRSGELAGEIAAGNWSRTVRVACVDSGDELRTSTDQDRMMSELLMFSSACRSVRVINSSTIWFSVFCAPA